MGSADGVHRKLCDAYRVLFEFLWHDRKPRFPNDAFAADFFPEGEWEQLRERVLRSEPNGLWDRAGYEIAHLSYKRLARPETGRAWRFDLIAGVVGYAFRLFLERVSPALVADAFEQRMRSSLARISELTAAVSFPSTTNPRTIASQTLQDLSQARVASFEGLLTYPDDRTLRP